MIYLIFYKIISPHDKGIAQSILNNLEPWTWDAELVNNDPLCIDNVKEISDFYFEELKALSYHRYSHEYNILINKLISSNLNNFFFFREDNASSKVKFVYTPMHGVGTPVAKRAFEVFSLNPFIITKEQEDPDP